MRSMKLSFLRESAVNCGKAETVLAFNGQFCMFNHKAITGRRGGKESGFAMKTIQRNLQK